VTAFTCNSGTTEYWDAKSGGSVNATLDSYAISANTTLVIRSDSNACANHSVAFGSVDTVTWSGTGGTLKFDATNVRVIAYTGGSGNSPAFGTTITANNGTTGVFLGAWTTWVSEGIVPGSAIGAAGFIKLGQVSSPGSFNAGALTGITATCSGADVQGWIEIRGADAGTITMSNIAKVEAVEAWFEIGTTNATRGQVIPCPTCATNAGVFGGVWIETSAGSGTYEQYPAVGSTVAVAATATDSRAKQVWQTTGGIRIGNDGTNGVGYLPVTGCKVRIPATILTNCTRNATTGSGPRVLPNATIATRQEFITTNAGTVDLRGCVIQWYMNMTQAFLVKYKGCAISDSLILSEIASPLDVDNCMVTPTQAQVNNYLAITSCFGGGTIQNSQFFRFSLANSATAGQVSYATGVTFSNNIFRCLVTRGTNTASLYCLKTVSCTFSNNWQIGGGRILHNQCISPSYTTGLRYSDNALTTATTTTAPNQCVSFGAGTSGVVFDGSTCPISFPTATHQPNGALFDINGALGIEIRNIGTKASPLVCNPSGSATIVGVAGSGNSANVRLKRSYMTGLSTGPFSAINSDSDWIAENFNVVGYGGTGIPVSLNTQNKGCRTIGATTGQAAQYGTHWRDVFTAATTGTIWLMMNEATAASAAQCAKTGGTPQFSSTGNLLLTKSGDQVTWEMPYYCLGHTAFATTAVGVTGTNVTYVSGSTWGNHTLEFQIDLNNGSGYNGTWTALTATNLRTFTISPSLGFKLKIRATTYTVAAGNILTNIRIYTESTDAAQDNYYPISVNTLTLTGIVTGSDVTFITAGTETVLQNSEDISGTTSSFVFSGAQNVDVTIYKPGYIPYYVRNLALTAADMSLPVSQVVDSSYVA
jgi:hypothetical protein